MTNQEMLNSIVENVKQMISNGLTKSVIIYNLTSKGMKQEGADKIYKIAKLEM